jgi:glutaminyl-peptide cyclotransferase
MPAEPPRADGGRALAEAEAFLAIGPRPAGSAGAARAAAWLEQRCRDLGAEVRTDTWQEATPAGRTTFRNVIATLPGRDRKSRILLGSHYDSKRLWDAPGFVGANDSGSSTGLLLELIRVLAASRPQPGPTLEFAFFDGEECHTAYGPGDGLHGSRRLAGQLAASGSAKQYRAMILLDMVGDRDLTLTLPTDTHPGLARRTLRLAAAQGVARQVGFANGPILDDHVPFQELGIPAIDFIDFEYGPGNRHWHTAEDTPDKLAAASLGTVGNLVLALLHDLRQTP